MEVGRIWTVTLWVPALPRSRNKRVTGEALTCTVLALTGADAERAARSAIPVKRSRIRAVVRTCYEVLVTSIPQIIAVQYWKTED